MSNDIRLIKKVKVKHRKKFFVVTDIVKNFKKKSQESRRVASIFSKHFIFKYETCFILKQKFEIIFHILDMHIFIKHNKSSQ